MRDDIFFTLQPKILLELDFSPHPHCVVYFDPKQHFAAFYCDEKKIFFDFDRCTFFVNCLEILNGGVCEIKGVVLMK